MGSGFADPRAFEVTVGARRAAAGFLEKCRAADDRDLIVCFEWFGVRRLRRKGTNEWRDLGAGFDLAICERTSAPAAAVAHGDGFDYVIKAPERAPTSGRRTIDFDDAEGRLTLR